MEAKFSEKIRASFIKKITPLIGRKEETENARAQWTSLLKEPVSLQSGHKHSYLFAQVNVCTHKKINSLFCSATVIFFRLRRDLSVGVAKSQE